MYGKNQMKTSYIFVNKIELNKGIPQKIKENRIGFLLPD